MDEAPVKLPGRRDVLWVGLGFGLILFGLWVALRYVFSVWRPDSDIYVTVELWRGIREHGLAFVSTWRYTKDNWLLSLIPISSLIFNVFGPTPIVTLGIGWLIFASGVTLTAMVVAHIAGWRPAMVIAAVCAFANIYAIGPMGYLGYTISHAVSMTWGLAMLLACLACLRARRFAWVWMAVAGLLAFTTTLSDPWTAVALVGPTLLASSALAIVHRGTDVGRRAIWLCGAMLLADLGAQTKGFGLFGFLTPTEIKFATLDGMLVNLYWAYCAMATMFNIIPGAATDATVARILSVAALLMAVGGSAVSAALQLRRATPARQFTFAVMLTSLAATSALYLVLWWDPNLKTMAGRFFPNVFYFGAALIAMVAADAWGHLGVLRKGALVIYGGLLIISGLYSGHDIWRSPFVAPTAAEARDIGGFLAAHDLAYGFGPFWGTHALVMDSATAGQVTVRPVTFAGGRVARRGAETSSHWYGPGSDAPSDRQFLLIRSDGEECPDTDACVAAAIRQFGPEAERLTYKDIIVLVWRQRISDHITL